MDGVCSLNNPDRSNLKKSLLFECMLQASSQGPEAGNRQHAYQLDFTTPGSLPWEANTRKQIRQMPNFLKNARGRPQTGHRL
jgi:hypothetical protein